MLNGQLFSHYLIIKKLGAGGMGEVYLAEDRRLGRKVALKLLPSELTEDKERLNRFELEARAASALNHPNIITIYEIGKYDGIHFLATEYIDGKTLRQKIEHGPLTLAEVLDIALQTTSALAAAHAAGIVHRDIKPENIMMRPDGYVKVLDFGLAKFIEVKKFTQPEAPTMHRTSQGMMLGTPHYMSPEQVRGLEVGAQSDIFSLGVVLYEVISKQLPFRGDTISDLIVSILEREPLPLKNDDEEMLSSFEPILMKALRKEVKDRYQTVNELLTDIKNLKQELEFEAELQRSMSSGRYRLTSSNIQLETMKEPTPAAVRRAREARTARQPIFRISLVVVIAGLIVAAGTAAFLHYSTLKPVDIEKKIELKSQQITTWSGLDIYPNFSPDGRSIVYSSDRSGKFEIYIRQLTAGGKEIQLTNNGAENLQPAWSPNGELIAYYCKERSGIWVVPALGGTPRQLTEFGSRPAWSPDGSMLAFQSEPLTDLGVTAVAAMSPSTIWIVALTGGSPKQLTKAGNPPGGHGEPYWSPDSKRIVFTASDARTSEIWSVSTAGLIADSTASSTKTPANGEVLLSLASNGRYCFNPIYSPDGRYIYYSNWDTSNNGIYRLSISAETGKPEGDAVQLANLGLGKFKYLAIARDGKRLAYSAVSLSSNLWSVPISPTTSQAVGRPEALTKETGRSFFPTFSGDGKLAFNRSNSGASTNIWLLDAEGNPVQLTSEAHGASVPSWFPGSDRIAYQSNHQNHSSLWSIQLSNGKTNQIAEFDQDINSVRLSPDGKQIAFNSKRGNGIINLWLSNTDGSAPRQLTADREMVAFPCWSPDGEFIAAEMKRGEDQHIAIIPRQGGSLIQLTTAHGLSWPHSWAPDSDKIAFAGFRNGSWNIWWVSRTTRTEQQLTDYSKVNAYVRYPAWSPKGDRIVYEYAETTGNIWLIDNLP